MDLTTVSPKNQVVIPKQVREQFGVRPGRQLKVVSLPGRIELLPSQLHSMLRGFLSGEKAFELELDHQQLASHHFATLRAGLRCSPTGPDPFASSTF